MIEQIPTILFESFLFALSVTTFVISTILIYLAVEKKAFSNGMVMIQFSSLLYFVSAFCCWVLFRLVTLG